MTGEQIRDALEEARARRGISYTEIAERTGIGIHTVTRFLAGRTKCGIRMINAADIAEAVGLELTVRRKEPRLMTYEEIAGAPYGFGWLEEDHSGAIDDLPGSAGDYILEPCCWSDATETSYPYPVTVSTAVLGEFLRPEEETYNRPGGWRIWTDRPTEEQRRTEKWDS